MDFKWMDNNGGFLITYEPEDVIVGDDWIGGSHSKLYKIISKFFKIDEHGNRIDYVRAARLDGYTLCECEDFTMEHFLEHFVEYRDYKRIAQVYDENHRAMTRYELRYSNIF